MSEQRARKKARGRALHAKIKNSRKDLLHQLSTALAKEYGAIFIGNANASALARTSDASMVAAMRLKTCVCYTYTATSNNTSRPRDKKSTPMRCNLLEPCARKLAHMVLRGRKRNDVLLLPGGVWFDEVDEVDEAYSTVTCSCCKRRTGPTGQEGLRIREWACLECGTYHHRDINSAANILAAGRRRLAVGIPALCRKLITEARASVFFALSSRYPSVRAL